MKKALFALILFFSFTSVTAQQIRISGNAKDTVARQPLQNVLLMAIRLSDSTLAGHTRTDNKGLFKPITIPADTYIVIMSHPMFTDKNYFLLPQPGDTAFHFQNIILPPKSHALKEVEIIAYREKSYYKGDTLVFTADSFKTRANATVEDLLKKLPGFTVDSKGKITVQGKEVDQVLVDGDEFFGGDPTVATRNLNATAIENVQVYEKKNENAEEGKDENLKVVNLKLKEDAKKGYFGKVSGSNDFGSLHKNQPFSANFFENELLANRFRGDMKISVFGLFANTPKQAFDWREIDRYGLSNEQQWSFDEESGNWSSNRDDRTGVPQTLKSGFYFSNRFSKKFKLNADYTFNDNRLFTSKENRTQFFLQDTSYVTQQSNTGNTMNMSHALNTRAEIKLDSLTDLVITPRGKMNMTNSDAFMNDAFISATDQLTRETMIRNKSSNEVKEASVQAYLTKRFKKKDRIFTLNYRPSFVSNVTTSSLTTQYRYYLGQLPDSLLEQRRIQEYGKTEHNANISYTEPWTKKIRTEFTYLLNSNQSSNIRTTRDIHGPSDEINPQQTNNFLNERLTNRGGTRLIYEVRKWRLSAGVAYRNVQQNSTNVSTGQLLSVTNNNILPNAGMIYRPSQSANLRIFYNTNSQLPEVHQLQPVVDNTDPNRLSTGNPLLLPTMEHKIDVNYYSYKVLTETYFWAGGNASVTNDQISYTTNYDSLGRAITYPINVNGNYNANVWTGFGHPVFKKWMKIGYNISANSFQYVSYVNGARNISRNFSIDPHLSFEKQTEKLEARIEGGYSYHVPSNNISSLSNQPYYTYNIEGDVRIKLPKKFTLATDGKYTDNGNRTPGYNLRFFIWNASISKAFYKTEAFVISLHANDILNQSISNQRFITSNMIVDTKTQIIRRYFLLKLMYKFNSQKVAENSEDED